MFRFKKTTFKLISRTIISIENFQSVISFFSKIDFILKTKDSLLVKAKKRLFDVNNKRSKSKFDGQSIKRLKSCFEHIEKNPKTRRNNKKKKNKKNKNERNRKKDTDKRMSNEILHSFSIE